MRTPAIATLIAPALLAGLVLTSAAVPGTAGPAAAGPAAAGPAAAGLSPAAVSRGHTAARACRGAVVRRVDAGTLPRSPLRLCIAVGGVVRVENLGPGLLTATPSGRVQCGYGGGVHKCRLIRTGQVRFTVRNGEPRRIAVTVAKASRPPKPSPACLPRHTALRLDATEGGPAWWAECLKLGAVVRFENLRPGGLTVTPRRAVSCTYAAGVHSCRLRAPATITFTARTGTQTRPITVVAIR